jgi:hypothetical protein
MRVGSDLNLVGVARLLGLARLLVNYVIFYFKLLFI